MFNSEKRFNIAISGFSGCGNTTVGKLVSDLMNMTFVNYTFRSVADEDGLPFEEVCRLADESEEYDLRVDTKQVELARKASSIMGSRLAIWMLQEAQLKVFLTASLEVRAKRIHQREGGNIEKQLELTCIRDKKDRARYSKLYNIDTLNYTSLADLIINTNRLKAEEIAQVIQDTALIIMKR